MRAGGALSDCWRTDLYGCHCYRSYQNNFRYSLAARRNFPGSRAEQTLLVKHCAYSARLRPGHNSRPLRNLETLTPVN